MRILQWAFPYFPNFGGREVFVEQLIQGLKVRSIDVTVVAQAPLGNSTYKESRDDVDLRISPEWKVDSAASNQVLKTRQKLTELLEGSSPQIIHLHNIMSIGYDFLREINKSRGLPLVLTIHDTFFTNPEFRDKPSVMQEVRGRLSEFDALVAVSPYVKKAFLETFPEFEAKVSMIPNGTKLAQDLAPLGKGFLFMGRLSPEKGVVQLVSAFHLLNLTDPETRLTIAGDGPQRLLIQRLIEDLNLADAVSITGWLEKEELIRLIRAARAVVIPSVWQEPFGLVAIEAMAQGKPILYTDHGALPWIAENGRAGLSFQSGAIDHLVSALRYLQGSPEAAASLGATGAGIIADRFDFDQMVDAYVNLFNRIIESRMPRKDRSL